MEPLTPATPDLRSTDIDVRVGDALRILRTMPSGSVDAVVCDPPYAIRATQDPGSAHRTEREGPPFPALSCRVCASRSATGGYDACAACLDDMRISVFADAPMLGQQSANWHEKATHSRGYADNDNAAFGLWVSLWASECLRLLKPGGHIVAFGGTRTWHRLACAIEDAGFEMRDSLAWLYATGVPKSLDVGRAVARLHGHADHASPPHAVPAGGPHDRPDAGPDQRPATGERWEGWYTGVKPAHEPIVLARRPLEGTVAQNVLAHATGALNVAATRIEGRRWPTNVYMDDHQADMLDRGLGERGSRFFYVAKPDARERVNVDGVAHPTVKPLALMRELVRLVTPPGGTVLDPFAGSGSTLEACVLERRRCLGIEREPAYLPLIRARLARSTGSPAADAGISDPDPFSRSVHHPHDVADTLF